MLREPRSADWGTAANAEDASLELLQNLDPTFWCLEDFMALADQTSQLASSSFQDLVNLYVSSLTCQYLSTDNYYYDKSVLFDSPQLLVGTICRYEAEVLSRDESPAQQAVRGFETESPGKQAVRGFETESPAQLAVHKLRQIAHRYSADPHSLYLKCCDNWPSETQICALTKRFSCFDQLFPLKKCQARSQQCMESFEAELQAYRLRYRAHAPPAAPPAAKSLNEIFNDTRHIVENKFRVDNYLPSTPRKRCFEFVEMDFNFGSAPAGANTPNPGTARANNENCFHRALATPKRMKF